MFLQGVTKISNYLLSKKQGHSFVVLVNLRNDVAVECDGKAYSVRDTTLLDEPIIHPGLTKEVLEVIMSLKNHNSAGRSNHPPWTHQRGARGNYVP